MRTVACLVLGLLAVSSLMIVNGNTGSASAQTDAPGKAPSAGSMPASSQTVDAPEMLDARGECQQAYSNLVYGLFEPSLEMRENADFLVTPAVLVQEAITDGVVITYPNE